MSLFRSLSSFNVSHFVRDLPYRYFLFVGFFFFFKQKTPYDVRISDWSSDVCSSDLDLPVLEEAGIPSIANLGVGSMDFQSPVAYPITAGTAGYAVAMGSLASSIGAVEVGVVYVDVEGGALAGAAVSFGLSPNGGSASTQVPVAPNTPDLAAAYAAASDGVDALAIALTTADATRFVVAARQAGGEAALIAPQAALDPDSLEALGDDADGVYLTSYFLPVSEEHPEMADVLADFQALGGEFAFDDVAVNAWAGVTIFALAAEQAADLTGPSIRAALDRMGELDIAVVPPLSFPSPVAGLPPFRPANPRAGQ